MEQSLLVLTGKLAAISVIIQMLEYLVLRKEFTPKGIWPSHRLGYSATMALIAVGLIGAIGFLFQAHVTFAGAMLIATLGMALRFRGSFNGGSDSMSLVILGSLTFGLAAAPYTEMAPRIAILYIGVQSLLSYFIGGLAKIRHPKWRTGEMMAALLMRAGYYTPNWVHRWAQSGPLMFVASWMILIFECTFPAVLLHPALTLVYLGFAIVFHVVNGFVFGLNRFLFAWIASYPALIYCCWLLQSTR